MPFLTPEFHALKYTLSRIFVLLLRFKTDLETISVSIYLYMYLFLFSWSICRVCTCPPFLCRYSGFFPRKMWASFSISPTAFLPGQLSSICCVYVHAVLLRCLQHPSWARNIIAMWKSPQTFVICSVQNPSHFSSRKTGLFLLFACVILFHGHI